MPSAKKQPDVIVRRRQPGSASADSAENKAKAAVKLLCTYHGAVKEKLFIEALVNDPEALAAALKLGDLLNVIDRKVELARQNEVGTPVVKP